jgi:Spy/CpxP family protein refolding chaperone
MQRNSKRIIGGLVLVGTLILAGVIGLAQQQPNQGQDGRERHERRGGGEGWRGGDRGGFPGGFFERLNLTDAQKAQMEQISARYHETFKALRQQDRAKQGKGGFDLFSGGTFDEAAVRAAAQARANAQVEMEVARARMMYEMYNVLTAEQKSQLAAERQQWEQKRQEFRSRRKAPEGQNQ